MTARQLNLISKIRSLKIVFTDCDCGIISPEVSTLISDMQSKLLDSIHTSSILPPNSRGMWRTTVYVTKGGKKTRRDICAKTKEALLNKLYDFYIGPGTLEDIHTLWAMQRKEENLASATLQRERQRWDKYLAGTDLAKKRIDEIDNFLIEAHLLKIVKEFSITAKELSEIKFLLRKTFNYAFRHRMIPANPMSDVEVNTTGCAPAQPKISETRVYLSEEISAIQNEIDTELLVIPHNTTALAIRLLFVLGLRVGELVALRASDINWENLTIHIQRMEQRAEKGKPILVNHTKKKSPYGNRILPLGDSRAAIIRQVIQINRDCGFQDEDFLFLGENGQRIHIRAVDNRIRKLCTRAGIIPAKSAHDIRRTVATRLYRNTHDIELVRKFLGHSDVQTTWGYIVDIDGEEEDRRKVVEALRGLAEPLAGSSGNIIAFKAKEAQNRSYDVSEPAYGLVPENSRHEYVDMPKIGLSAAQKTGHTVVTHLFQAK